MAKRSRQEANEWLTDGSTDDFISRGVEDVRTLVEDLYKAGAVKVEIGETKHGFTDALFVTLPKGRDPAIDIMEILGDQYGDEVARVEGEKDVVRILWE